MKSCTELKGAHLQSQDFNAFILPATVGRTDQPVCFGRTAVVMHDELDSLASGLGLTARALRLQENPSYALRGKRWQSRPLARHAMASRFSSADQQDLLAPAGQGCPEPRQPSQECVVFALHPECVRGPLVIMVHGALEVVNRQSQRLKWAFSPGRWITSWIWRV